MLQEVCEHLHNRFIRAPHAGRYSVHGSMLSPCDFLLEGQRFWIFGSVLNDGMYTYHSTGCTIDDDGLEAHFADETFDGTVCALAVPAKLVSIAAEIAEWNEKYGETLTNPYQSESFGGYSYSKTQLSKSRSENPTITWQTQFASKLNAWRKPC